MVQLGGWLVVIALLPMSGCSERSGRREDASAPATAPGPRGGKEWDYSGWVWIYAEDGRWRFAVPPGSWDPLALTEKPLESTPENPCRRGSLLNVRTPCGQYLMFLTSKQSEDLSNLSARAFLRGSLYGTLGAQDVSEGKVFRREGGTAVQYICKCRQDPFTVLEGDSFTAVVRVVQAGGNDYILQIVAPDTKYDEACTAQILESLRLRPTHGSSE